MDMYANDEIQGYQLRMNCGKSSFVDEEDNFVVSFGRVKKKIETKYLTGNVQDDNTITPIAI